MKLFLPLNIQLFADGDGADGSGGTASQTQESNQQTQGIDYSRIEEIITKRSNQAQDSVLKGYLKQQGLSGEELDQAVANYKAQKQQATIQAQQEQENMRQENARLKTQILNSTIDNRLTSLAAAEGVNADKIPFLAKLIDRSGLTDDKGNVLDDKIKEAMNTVIKAFPDFKGSSQQNNGFQQIGSGGTNQNTNSVDEKLDAIFGIKKK